MDIGTKVTGVYLGQQFSGTIVDRRHLTVKTDGAIEHTIKLDSPITIYGRVAETILAHTLFDGSASSYTQYDVWMRQA